MVDRQQVVALIHGWALGSWVWQDFVQHLQHRWQIVKVDLPGYGVLAGEIADDIEHWLDIVSPQVPINAVLVGWSLGGTVAIRLASRRPDIKVLILLASNPCFLNSEDWHHGAATADFEKLEQQLACDKVAALKMFLGLVTKGDRHPRQSMRFLQQQLKEKMPPREVLQSGLQILRQQDLRQILVDYSGAIGMVFGSNDILVKPQTGKAMQAIRSDIRIAQITEVGHAPFLSWPQETATILINLFDNLMLCKNVIKSKDEIFVNNY